MKKKAALLALLLAVSAAFLPGCDDYHGIEELTIIAGVAVDVDEDDGELYKLTFEIVDTRFYSEADKRATYLLETTDKSINGAVQKLSAKMKNQLSFSHVEVMILGLPAIKTFGLNCILEPFMRDRGIRDNLTVLVSTDKSASAILSEPSAEKPVNVSFELHNNFLNDGESLDSVKIIKLYQAYGLLAEAISPVTLPCIRLSDSEKSSVIYDGQAVISKYGSYAGRLDAGELKMYLLSDTVRRSGDYYLEAGADPETGKALNLSVAIRETEPKKSFSYDGERFTLTVDVPVTVAVVALSPEWGEFDDELISAFEKKLSESMSATATETLGEIQSRLGADILSFSRVIRGRDPALWREISEDWDEYYLNAEIKISCDVHVNSTGLLTNY